MWNVVINRLLFCVVLMQALMVLSKPLICLLNLSIIPNVVYSHRPSVWMVKFLLD